MPKNKIILLIYHRRKLLGLIYTCSTSNLSSIYRPESFLVERNILDDIRERVCFVA
jgi:hypothetical protein